MSFGQALPSPVAQFHGRIGLRIITQRDAHVLRRLLTENREWLKPWEATHPSGGGSVPGSVSMRPLIRQLRARQRAGTGLSFVLTYDDEVVGQLSVSDISWGALGSAQIGYWVSKHVAGRGVVTAAVALAIDLLMWHYGLHRVEICIRPENRASLRVVEKLGLRYEGTRERYIHIDGAWRDHFSFAVTREEVDESGMIGRVPVA